MATAPVPPPAQPLLEISEAGIYYGESVVIPRLEMQVRAGQVVCLMGRNGVGKTTLLRAIMGTLRLRRGAMHYAGQNITAWPSHRRARAGIGYVPQGRGIFPFLSVRENLLMGLEAVGRPDDPRYEEMCALFPVLGLMARRTAGTLSGGQQQQLALARALMARPRLLLLDEPTEGIQPSIVQEIERVIISLRDQGGVTILLVEQFLDFALSVADFCYVMDHGEMVAKGPAAVMNSAEVREYLAV